MDRGLCQKLPNFVLFSQDSLNVWQDLNNRYIRIFFLTCGSFWMPAHLIPSTFARAGDGACRYHDAQ